VAEVSGDLRTRGDRIDCDVLVVGGGAAGVAAATAAGRAGARVVLLEKYGFLGGLATAGEVGTVCGLYLRNRAQAQPALVAGGFVAEFASRLQQAAGRKPLRLEHGLWVLPYATGAFARVADTFVGESGNVTPVLHAVVAEARAEGPRLTEIRALVWNELVSLRPKAVVDCSGEATAAALAGASVEDGAADQVPALVFCLEGLTPEFAERGLLEVRRELRRGVDEGRLPGACEKISVVPGSGGDGRLALKLNLSSAGPDRTSWQRVTDWERQSRALVHELVRFLVDNTASCRHARLRAVAPQLGVRSGRRIRGHATLTDLDVVGARKTPLGIARGCWPMERWGARPQPEMIYLDEGGYYEVGVDCLRPVELDNVLAAGRCFAAEAAAMTSARVIGTALATGWAAGMVAAFQAMGRPIDEAVDLIRKQMVQ
jgi:hypothetical protein